MTSAATGTTPEPRPVVQRTPVEANPLANRTWGVYKGAGDQAWTPYQQAKGKKKHMERFRVVVGSATLYAGGTSDTVKVRVSR